MKKNELKILLNKYNYIVAEIEDCNQEILQLSEVVAAERELKVSELSDMPRGNGISDTTYKKVEKIIDCYSKQVAKIETNIEGLFYKKNMIEELVKSLDPNERKIIELKYFKKYKWWMIQHTMNYSRTQCFNIHDKAIIKMLKRLN